MPEPSLLGDSRSQIQNPTQMATSSGENADMAGQGSRQPAPSPSPSRPPLADKQALPLPLTAATQGKSQNQNLPRSQGKKLSLSPSVVNQDQPISQNQQANRPKQMAQSRDIPRQEQLSIQPNHQAFLPAQLRLRNTVQNSQTLRRDQQKIPSNQTRQAQQPQQGRLARDQTTVTPNQGWSNNLSHSRPAPHNRQLFNPGPNGPQHHYQYRGPVFEGPTDIQIDFLTDLADIEIPKAQMTLEELEEKETLRLKLQEICRDAISNHESTKEKQFKKNSVALKCFGSLSSGFATKSSDMDLALVSPYSTPDASSAESEIPRLLEKALLDSGYGARLLTQTRVPIIKFCEKPTSKLTEALNHAREKFEKQRDFLAKLAAERREALKNQGPKNICHNGVSSDNATNDKPEASTQSPQLLVTKLDQNEQATNQGGNEATNDGAIPRSDEELVFLYKLAMEEGWYDDRERQIIHEFVRAVKEYGSAVEHSALDKARVALSSLSDVLSKYRAPPEKDLDFPKNGVGIQCDINFSNPLALHNTRLLRCYALCDERVRPLVLFVKAWAKRRKINSPYRGTLSSYGYVLMVLHYLANVVDPPIIPNLQTSRKAWQDTSPENSILVDGYNVRFWRSEKEIKDLARRKMLTRNTQDGIGILICGFFHYYANQNKYSPGGGFSWTTDVISLRTPGGILRKQTKDWISAKTVTEPAGPGQQPREIRHRYLLAIEDPFELQHNIARTVIHPGIVDIRDEFRRAISIIQSVGREGVKVADLFAEGRELIPPPRRAFGPLPRTNSLDENGVEKHGGRDATVNNEPRKEDTLHSGFVEVVETNRSGDTKRQNGSKYSKKRIPKGRNGPDPLNASSNLSLSRQPSPSSSGKNSRQ